MMDERTEYIINTAREWGISVADTRTAHMPAGTTFQEVVANLRREVGPDADPLITVTMAGEESAAVYLSDIERVLESAG